MICAAPGRLERGPITVHASLLGYRKCQIECLYNTCGDRLTCVVIIEPSHTTC
jgi:hypothetical protein